MTVVAVVAVVVAVSIPWRGAPATDDEPTTPSSATVGERVVHYVALGSSYAAGPDSSDIVDRRCLRGGDDYPHRVAAAESMDLTDVTCSGSTIPDILRRAQPGRATRPQIDAVTADTDLVTVTTGGNDVHYIPRLTDLSCANAPARQAHRLRHCHPERPSSVSSDGEYAALEAAMVAVVDAVRARAPRAVVMIVDYIPVLDPSVLDPSATLCADVPLTPAQAAETVATFDRLTAATRAAADRSGAILVDAAAQAAGHTVCSSDPWVSGFVPPAPYHPNAAGREAMAALTIDAIRTAGVVPASVPS
ncbi:SGNH/GDSL hydrolase family protein [Williamsia deligens]|nr:GDSL-like Lipase/Acylhydrolase family protein [Williamsia deligens]